MRKPRSEESGVQRPRSFGSARLGGLLVALAALVGAACSSPRDHVAPPPGSAPGSAPAATTRAVAAPSPHQAVLRPNDLIGAPESFVGREVTVAIVEPLAGPETPEALAKVEYGQIRVRIPDNVGTDFALVPGTFKKEDPNRYRARFDRVISGPILVRGVFESDDDLARSLKHPAYVLRVASIEPLPVEAPVVVKGLSDFAARRAELDRRAVVYEGVWTSAFETSMLDDQIWLTRAREVTESGTAPSWRGTPQGMTKERVRVTGFLFARPGALYGHLGGFRAEILATKIEHLGSP